MGGYFVCSDPWERDKIDSKSAKSRAAATRVVPVDLPIGWVHLQYDAEWTRHDPSNDYIITPRSVEDWQVWYNGY